MKKVLFLFLGVALSFYASSQCSAGYTSASLNWDALDFLNTNSGYATYVSASAAATQNFAFGTEKVTITHSYTGANNLGVNITNTGESGSFGAGADVQFKGNGTITLTFQTAVKNVTFSLYDIDRSQRAAITASNSGTAMPITLATLGGASSVLTISNNSSTTARVDASNTSVATTSVNGTVNVTVSGPVTSVTITISNTGVLSTGPVASQEDGSFWLSDVTACTTAAAFPTSYYAISQPFTGQPGYVLTAMNNSVYRVSTTDGSSRLMFTDATHTNINSLGYDPYKRILYYTYSLTSTPATDKTIMKYDVATGTISTLVSDVTTLGVIVYENGVESGAAAFYNGSLFLGVEGYGSDGRKSIVWRIDFNTSGVPTGAVQVYGVTAQTSGSIMHDWSDIGINNGVLYDFDGAASNTDIYQYNMQSGTVTHYTPTFTPKQIAVDWSGNIYNMDAIMTPYNGTTGLTTAQQHTLVGTPTFPTTPSFGDAGEAYKANADFGDAPDTYDPVATSPAMHDTISTLRIGAGVNLEYAKKTSVLADGDADDGIASVNILNRTGNYYNTVKVYNNTGSNAILCGWIDLNGNGTFETSEGVSIIVASSASIQNIDLGWTGVTNSLALNSYTYMRIRLALQSSGMTTANPTGYYSTGEVEDYRVIANSNVLRFSLLDFKGTHATGANNLVWKTVEQGDADHFELERSADGKNFSTVTLVQPSGSMSYSYVDKSIVAGSSYYYRLRMVDKAGMFTISNTVLLEDANDSRSLVSVVWPNPFKERISYKIYFNETNKFKVLLMDATGRTVLSKTETGVKGLNDFSLEGLGGLVSGIYILKIITGTEVYTEKVVHVK